MRYLVATILFIGSLFIYLKTLCPTVFWQDSGNLISVGYILGIAHPPGYPLYALLGKLFTFLPFSSIAFRLNLMSAFFASLTVALVYFIGLTVCQSNNRPTIGFNQHIPAIVASLIFAFSHSFWSQAVIAETYTLNAFFIALMILILLHWREPPTSAHHHLPFTIHHSLNLFAFLYGLSLGNHHSMLMLLPPIFYIILVKGSSLSLIRNPMQWMLFAGFFFLGLSVYLYLPIRSLQNPPLDWGDPQTLKNFLAVLARKQYPQLRLGRSPELFLKQLASYGNSLVKQFTGHLAWLGVLGAGLLLRRDKRLFLFTLLIFLGGSLGFIVWANFPINEEFLLHLEVFYIPSFVIFSLWIGRGVRALAEIVTTATHRFKRGQVCLPLFSVLLLASPIIALKAHYYYVDRSKNRFAHHYATNIFESVDKGGIIFTKLDDDTFPLWYLQFVEGVRPDVIIINAGSLHLPGYLSRIKENYPDLIVPAGGGKMVDSIVSANIALRPIYCTRLNIVEQDSLFPNGLIFKVAGRRRELDESTLRYHDHLLRTYTEPQWQDKTVFKDIDTVITHARVHISLGDYFYDRGMLKRAASQFRKAIEVDPSLDLLHYLIGFCLYENGLLNEAASAYEEALRINPDYAEVHNALGVIYAEYGRDQEAMESFRKAISLGKGETKAKAYHNLGLAYSHKGWYNEAIVQHKKSLQIEPDCVEAHINLGVAYYGLGLRETAIRRFERALELDPDNEKAEYNLRKVRSQP